MDAQATAPIPEPRKPPPLLRTAVALTALFLFEWFGGGIFMVSIVVSIFGALFLVPLGMVAGATDARALAISRFKRAGLYLLLGTACLVATRVRTEGGRADAERVIKACQAYKSRHGTFPEHLEDLVPTDLPAVPLRLRYWDWSAQDHRPHHVLSYIAVPPYGQRLYHLEDGTWSASNVN